MVATRKRARVPGSLDDSPLAVVNTSRLPLELTGGHAQPSRMIEYYRQGKLCDVTIQVEGRTYAAHRNVLAAASDYLDRLFAGPAWADQTQPVKLSQVPGAHTFAQILEYIYTGKCNTHEGDLIPMLEASHYLQIEPLLCALQDLVSRRVDASNCLDAWSVADRYALEMLSATAMRMALRSFEQVGACPNFLTMPIQFVRALLSDDKLIAREEQAVFEAVVRWLLAQERTTEHEQQTLLSLVRYPLLPHGYVVSRVQREPLILRHPLGLGLLLESYQQRVYALPDSRLHRRRLGQMPRGVLRPVTSDFLLGWEQHFEVPYSQRTQPSDITSVPERATHVFVGARAPDGHIALGAMGRREEVLRRTVGNDTHEENGACWYFASNEDGEDTSFGFSRTERVDLSNADVLGSGWMDNPKDEDGHYRLSWHLDEESVPGAGGWRAGQEIDLHEGPGDSWMKLIYFACI